MKKKKMKLAKQLAAKKKNVPEVFSASIIGGVIKEISTTPPQMNPVPIDRPSSHATAPKYTHVYVPNVH